MPFQSSSTVDPSPPANAAAMQASSAVEFATAVALLLSPATP